MERLAQEPSAALPQSEDMRREYRYERKFLVDQLDAHQARVLIRRHPGLFYSPYPPRYINNFYLDTKDMQHYHDNIDGSMERRKVRVRWYGDALGQINKPTLEIKIKQGMVGTKLHYPTAGFRFDNNFSDRYFHQILAASDFPDLVKEQLNRLNVVLFNRYFRRYFATRDGRFRVTLDTKLSYSQIRPLRASLIHHQTDHRHIVVELKYSPEHDTQANRISAWFPFSVTKSSKYVMGIEQVYL
jgi:SPX domain protein involved in polyphosphate accumulation